MPRSGSTPNSSHRRVTEPPRGLSAGIEEVEIDVVLVGLLGHLTRSGRYFFFAVLAAAVACCGDLGRWNWQRASIDLPF